VAGRADQSDEVLELPEPEPVVLDPDDPVEVVAEDDPDAALVVAAASAAERIAIEPPSPRNVATLSAAARTRDRAAACRFIRLVLVGSWPGMAMLLSGFAPLLVSGVWVPVISPP